MFLFCFVFIFQRGMLKCFFFSAAFFFFLLFSFFLLFFSAFFFCFFFFLLFALATVVPHKKEPNTTTGGKNKQTTGDLSMVHGAVAQGGTVVALRTAHSRACIRRSTRGVSSCPVLMYDVCHVGQVIGYFLRLRCYSMLCA